MKKLLACLFVVTLLTGCGGSGGSSEPVKESKTCSITEEGMDFGIKMNAVDNEIETINLTVSMKEDFSGVTITDEMKAALEKEIMSGYGIEEGAKGITTSMEVSDTAATIKMDLDVKNADISVMKAFDLDGFLTNMKLDFNVSDMESDGFSCK